MLIFLAILTLKYVQILGKNEFPCKKTTYLGLLSLANVDIYLIEKGEILRDFCVGQFLPLGYHQ